MLGFKKWVVGLCDRYLCNNIQMFIIEFLNFQQAFEIMHDQCNRPFETTKHVSKSNWTIFWRLKTQKEKLSTTQSTRSGQKMIRTQKTMHMKRMYLCVVESKTHYANHERKR
jgi:hypothetical protein